MLVAEQAVRPTSSPATAPARAPRGERRLALAAVLIYGGGMLGAMISGALLTGDWVLSLLILPQCLLAVAAGGGAMGMALLAPDPYVGEHGRPPGKLPDFS
jgi:hypothetical protein